MPILLRLDQRYNQLLICLSNCRPPLFTQTPVKINGNYLRNMFMHN